MTDLNKIKKRDGKLVEFREEKIVKAIVRAFEATDEVKGESRRHKEAERLAKIVVNILRKGVNGEFSTVEQVQDVVEQVLMAAGHFKPAKAYILYREKQTKTREAKEVIGVKDDLDLNVNQLKVLENRYLRHDELGKVTESPSDLFRRVAKFVASNEKGIKKQREWEEKFYKVISRMEFMPAGGYLRSAGTKKPMLANCFVLPVEDDMEAIFDAVKWLALVQQRGGGCIDGEANVFTSLNGLEKMKDVYNLFEGSKKPVKKMSNGWEIKIDDKNINTLGFDSSLGRLVKQKVRSVWKYLVAKEKVYIIKAEGGLTVKTSDWHPFFVYKDGEVIEQRADELKEGDYILSGNSSGQENWLFNRYQKTQDFKIDEKVGWLIGYILGDGSFGRVKANTKKKKHYQRLRLFDGRKGNLIKAQEILEELTGKKYKIQKDSRCETFSLTVVTQKIVKQLKYLSGIDGPKGDGLKIESELIKSPISVIAALLAGLLDSDGHVAKNRNRVTFDTESFVLAEQIMSLLGVFGIQSRIRKRKPTKKEWKMMYEVTIDGGERLERFEKLVSIYLADKVKKERLLRHVATIKQYPGLKSPLLFDELEPFLVKAGVSTRKTEIHKNKVGIGNKDFWLQRLKWGEGISCSQMMKVLEAMLELRVFSRLEKDKLSFWKLLHESFRKVEKIERGKKDEVFYDFTTDGHQNYLAGNKGMAVVHNTGFNFSKLRPKGDYVKKSGGFATGPVSFMKVFDAATAQVMQGGYRMGANMGVLDIDHPDILEFINCKTTDGEIANFNISVGMSDEFMKALKKGKKFHLKNPRSGEVVQTVQARQLFDQIVGLAWRTGDPGMIFLDKINKNNPVKDTLGLLEATNPCGEQPLHPFDVCNLGSINLAKMVTKRKVEYKKLEEATKIAVRFLDNGVDKSSYPIDKISKMAKANRRIGLGVMGFADMLYQLGIGYNSEAGVKMATKIMKFINRVAVVESCDLGKEKGGFKNIKGSDFEKKGIVRRNLAVTTIAPTGTIAMVVDASSGIEPNFALSYTKNVVDEDGLLYVNRYFKKAIEESNLSKDQKNEVLKRVAKTGSCQDIEYLDDSIKSVFVTAYDISPEDHIRMQAGFQRYTENAVSKTINFPATASMEEVEKAYILAWELGCKGITIYRSGSREGQVLSVESDKKTKTKMKIQSKVRIEPLKQKSAKLCPECGVEMEIVEGCATCRNCGFSKCSI